MGRPRFRQGLRESRQTPSKYPPPLPPTRSESRKLQQENHDIKLLKESDFVLNGKSYNVHLVVDGQQRLVSLYTLLEHCQHQDDRFFAGDPIIPKLILNPRTDHAHWRYLLKLDKTEPTLETTSQKRLHAMFETYKRQADFTNLKFPGSGGLRRQ